MISKDNVLFEPCAVKTPSGKVLHRITKTWTRNADNRQMQAITLLTGIELSQLYKDFTKSRVWEYGEQ